MATTPTATTQKATGMTAKYVRKITEGTMLWTDVPSLWYKKVQDELIAQGYILNEDGTVTKKED